jgi:hypothetical protein
MVRIWNCVIFKIDESLVNILLWQK